MNVVTIIGGDNVGKSTLFNKLARERISITSETPGCTIDNKETAIEIAENKYCKLIDTPSFIVKNEERSMQIYQAIKNANIVLFVVCDPLTLEDFEIKKSIHKHNVNNAKIILVVNKSERADKLQSDVYNLGLGDAYFISARGSLGMKELYQQIQDSLSKESTPTSVLLANEYIKIAIIGKPNVGKSTLINRIAGYNRVVTSPVAGTTRDCTWIELKHKEHHIKLFDTAGIRKNSHSVSELENLAISTSYSAIKHADIILLLIGSDNGLTRQDMQIANFVIAKGKPLIVAVNKCDLLPDQIYQNHISKVIRSHAFISHCPIIMLSALHDRYCTKLINYAIELHNIWNLKISTPSLNKWLGTFSNANQLISQNSESVKLKYISQIDVKPPSFVIFTNRQPKKNSVRYLIKHLKEEFSFSDININVQFRITKNKYSP